MTKFEDLDHLKRLKKVHRQGFIPCTVARAIGGNVFFRPIRSWHSATYAGEKLRKIPNSDDSSGCMFTMRDAALGFEREVCTIPYTVTHRLYWHASDLNHTVSAFLSYPGAMGYYGPPGKDGQEYFWEVYGLDYDEYGGDIERVGGEDAEAVMEVMIRKYFRKVLRRNKRVVPAANL